MTAEHLKPWEPFAPKQIGEIFASAPFLWWLAGGYAIERFAGRPLRQHGDIDVFILRRDQNAVRRHLIEFDCWAADPPGRLRPWPTGEILSKDIHDMWCRSNADGPWQFQLMIDESEGDEWVSRRDARIRRPIAQLGFMSDGTLTLAPEVQLYSKAKAPRAKDEIDFAAALPLLSAEQRAWLANAIETAYRADHPWLARL